MVFIYLFSITISLNLLNSLKSISYSIAIKMFLGLTLIDFWLFSTTLEVVAKPLLAGNIISIALIGGNYIKLPKIIIIEIYPKYISLAS